MITEGVRTRADVAALASLAKNKLYVLVWHYHDDDVPGPDADIELNLEGLPLRSGKTRMQQFRIDADHSNAFSAWQKLGSPPHPSPRQYAQLEKAGQLAASGAPKMIPVKQATAAVQLALQRQAVSLLVFEW